MKNIKSILISILFFSISNALFSQVFWEELNFPSDTLSIRCITTNNAGHIFLGLGATGETGGVLKSIDNGVSWELVFVLGFNFAVHSIDCNDNGYIYAGTSFGPAPLFVSKDNGDSWEEVDLQIEGIGNILSIYCKGQDTVYFSTWVSQGSSIVFSFDNGENWEQVYVNDKQNEYVTDIDITSNGEIYVSAKGYFMDQGGVYKSEDEGYTWEYVDLLNHQINALEINANDDVFTTDWWLLDYNEQCGINALYNGSDEFVNVYDATEGRDLAINSKNDIYACFSWETMFSIDNGQSFEEINNNIPYTFEELYRDCDDYIYGTTNKRLVRSMESTVTSVNTISQEHSVSILINPNPVDNELIVTLNNNVEEDSNIEVYIYDINAEVHFVNKFYLKEDQFSFDVSNLSPCVYVLQIGIGKHVLRQKFMKL